MNELFEKLISQFQITNLKYSHPFGPLERARTIKLVKEACKSLNIKIANPDMHMFLWNDKMGKDTVGAWSPWNSKCIFISSAYRTSPKDEGFKRLIPTIAHELRHVWQRKKLGWFYYLFTIPLIRNITIEIDAWYVCNVQINNYFKIDKDWWL